MLSFVKLLAIKTRESEPEVSVLMHLRVLCSVGQFLCMLAINTHDCSSNEKLSTLISHAPFVKFGLLAIYVCCHHLLHELPR